MKLRGMSTIFISIVQACYCRTKVYIIPSPSLPVERVTWKFEWKPQLVFAPDPGDSCTPSCVRCQKVSMRKTLITPRPHLHNAVSPAFPSARARAVVFSIFVHLFFFQDTPYYSYMSHLGLGTRSRAPKVDLGSFARPFPSEIALGTSSTTSSILSRLAERDRERDSTRSILSSVRSTADHPLKIVDINPAGKCTITYVYRQSF